MAKDAGWSTFGSDDERFERKMKEYGQSGWSALAGNYIAEHVAKQIAESRSDKSKKKKKKKKK